MPESLLNRNTFASRWRTIRKLKSNFALVVIGCLLVLLAISWRLAIAPALRVVATDIEKTYYYNTTITYYAKPPGQPAPGAAPVPMQVRIDRAILALPLDSTPSTATFQVETSLVVKDSLERLWTNTHVYAVDRETGKMVENKKADRGRSGYYLFFPFDTPKGSVPFWSELTGKTYPVKYQKSEVVHNVSTSAFTGKFDNQAMSEPPDGYPRSLRGAELKAMLSMPDLPVGDATTVEPSYIASGTVELLVEPRAGTVVRTNGGESVSVAVKGAGGEVIAERPLYKLEYSQTNGSVTDAAELAADEVSKIKLQFEYIPPGLLVLGILVFLIGAFAGVKKGHHD